MFKMSKFLGTIFYKLNNSSNPLCLYFVYFLFSFASHSTFIGRTALPTWTNSEVSISGLCCVYYLCGPLIARTGKLFGNCRVMRSISLNVLAIAEIYII